MPSLADSINTKKSYGACKSNHQSVMLSVINSKSIIHKLEPSDTLQGLAIKYGVSVEILKRVNKLWFNESIHIKDTLIIPCNKGPLHEPHTVELNANKTFENTKDFYDTTNTNKEIQINNADLNNKLNLSGKENEKHLANKINEASSSTGESDVLRSFNEMLCKIDGQIKNQKEKVQQIQPRGLPVVGYDSYQNYSVHTSPTHPHPYLEQGI